MKGSKQQIDKFVKAANEAACDNDEAAFENKLRKIAVAKTKPAAVSRPKNDKTPD